MNLLQNGLVHALQPASQALLCSRCKPVQLEPGEILSTPHAASSYVYFLIEATVALMVRDTSQPRSAGLAVGLAGNEGAIGLQQALGLGAGLLTKQVQTGGTAWRIDGEVLADMAQHNVHMMRAIGRYLWTVSQEVALMAANAQRHAVHQRLAAWIVLSATRAGAKRLNLTHAHLADVLGVRRASVTEAAIQLKDRDLLDYRRGQIHILNLSGLQYVAQHR